MILALDGFTLDGRPCTVLTSRAVVASVVLAHPGPERLVVYRHGSALPRALTTDAAGLLRGDVDGGAQQVRAIRAAGAHSARGVLVLSVLPDIPLYVVGRETPLGPDLVPLTVQLNPRVGCPELRLLTMGFLAALRPRETAHEAAIAALYYAPPATARVPGALVDQARLFVDRLRGPGPVYLVMDPGL